LENNKQTKLSRSHDLHAGIDPRLVAFGRLLDIMDELREKCPWDKKQTFESLRHLTIEETYELADALIKKEWDEVEGELGDLFLHLVFYGKLGSEIQAFTVDSVLNRICDKLIYRHPHIYANTQANTEQEVKKNWEKLKLQEGRISVLQGVPNALPALIKAARIQEKVRGVGFDWENKKQVWDKVEEEIQELNEELNKDSLTVSRVEEEFGDVLFSLVNYARFIAVNPENALEKANKKFILRFQKMEDLARQNQLSISQLTSDELNNLWEKAKAYFDEQKQEINKSDCS